jgi:FdhD protein
MKKARDGIGPGQVIRRKTDGSLEFQHDDLTLEEPLEIRVGRKAVATTMRTPGYDEELAAGFLVAEGLLERNDSILGIKRSTRGANRQNIVTVTLAPGAAVRLKPPRRLGTISSSCGLCGKENIAALRQQFSPIRFDASARMRLEVLLALPAILRREQEDFARTGGIHAAGIYDFNGVVQIVREDIGRHNAVDKVVGRAFLDKRLPLDRHILLVSGRASFEIMQKALSAGIPVVASVSAPSSLAVEFARESGQTLIGFLRPPSFNIYSHAERFILDDNKESS